jgi:hypothetical protein
MSNTGTSAYGIHANVTSDAIVASITYEFDFSILHQAHLYLE